MRNARAPIASPTELLRWTKTQRRKMEAWIRRAVELESPSSSKSGLDAMCEFLAEEFGGIGGAARIVKSAGGNHLFAEFPAGRAGQRDKRPPVLLLGHHDTVWELGTLRTMPCRTRGGRLWGPGAFDMKGGLAQMLFALRALREVQGAWPRAVTVFSVADEETGSRSSRAMTEKLALRSAAALVLEPAQGLHGALKTERKGVGDYIIRVRGKAAHAGVDFGAGANAIVELAQQLRTTAGFTDPARGITVNAGLIRGGSASNTVAANAEAEIDVRIRRRADAAPLQKKFVRLRAHDRRCHVKVEGGFNRPPMERTRAIAALFEKAKGLASQMDEHWKLEEAATGGASDGNLTSALGVPTLDGLGAVGEGAHAAHESILLAELPRRTALLAALIARL